MAIEPYDEDDISDEDGVIRRVNPEHHIVPDENTGAYRTSSKLFTPSSGDGDGMSVDIFKLIEAAEIDAKEFVTTPVFTGSVIFSAGAAREKGLRIGYDPITGVAGIEDNPFHGEVWGGEARPNRFSKGQKKALAAASRWFVELEGVEIKA